MALSSNGCGSETSSIVAPSADSDDFFPTQQRRAGASITAGAAGGGTHKIKYRSSRFTAPQTIYSRTKAPLTLTHSHEGTHTHSKLQQCSSEFARGCREQTTATASDQNTCGDSVGCIENPAICAAVESRKERRGADSGLHSNGW